MTNAPAYAMPTTDDACFAYICAAITDAAHYLIHSLTPRPFHDELTIHFSDDDTDYAPAAADLISALTNFIAADERDYADFFNRLATCQSIDPNLPICLHANAIDFHHALLPFMPADCLHDHS